MPNSGGQEKGSVDDSKVINLTDAKARAVGVSPQLLQVIDQINRRFGIHIDVTDERLTRFKMLFPALDEAASQQHQFKLDNASEADQHLFERAIEVGKAQMMTDVIICILEQDDLIQREQ